MLGYLFLLCIIDLPGTEFYRSPGKADRLMGTAQDTFEFRSLYTILKGGWQGFISWS